MQYVADVTERMFIISTTVNLSPGRWLPAGRKQSYSIARQPSIRRLFSLGSLGSGMKREINGGCSRTIGQLTLSSLLSRGPLTPNKPFHECPRQRRTDSLDNRGGV